MTIYSKCTGCGHVFPSVMQPDLSRMEAGAIWADNTETCRRCGGVAEQENFYTDFVNGVVEAVKTLTWSQAQEVRALVQAAQDEPENVAVYVDKISAISLPLASALRRHKGTVGLMAAATLVLSKCSVSVNVDVGDIIRAIQEQPAASAPPHVEIAKPVQPPK